LEQETRQYPSNWKTPFFTIWTGQAFSLFGSALVQFALVWWLTASTGSATVLATATLVAMLPAIFLGPVAGALVDRWNRRVVMIVADGSIALATLWLIALAAGGLMQPWHVYVIMFVRSAASSFHWPAMQASTTLMVPKEQLSRVAGLNQTLQGVMNIVAPPSGALLLGILPLEGVLAIDVVTALLAIAPLLFLNIPQPERRSAPAAQTHVEAGQTAPLKTSVWQDLREGLRYVRGWPGLMGVLIMATLINFLLNPASALMPILITKHFGGGPLELGGMDSVYGIGAVLGGVVLSVWGGFRRRIVTSMTGLIGIGAGFVIVGLTPAAAFGLALAGTFVAGIMHPITNGPLFAVVQATVAPEMQGRVFTLIQSAAMAMSPLSMVVAGPVADWLGVRAWYVVGGVVCALMGVAGFFIPAILHLEDNHRQAVSAGGETPATVGMPKIEEAA
jgi:DHA3 family macrolide efflux protein-like MFS transporter